MLQLEEQAAPGRGPSGAPGADALRLANGRRLPLVDGDLSIGRDPDNDVVLDDPTIAAHQARLLRFPEGWLVADLAGGRGTTVNGQPISYPVVLAPGDEIGLGRLVVAFEPYGAAALTDSQADRVRRRRDHARRPNLGAAAAGGFPRRTARSPGRRGEELRRERGTADGAPRGEPGGRGRGVRRHRRPVGLWEVDPAERDYRDRPAGRGHRGRRGQDVQRMGSDALARWRGRHIGIVFQFFQLLPTLTVAENVMLPMAFCQTARGSARRTRARPCCGEWGWSTPPTPAQRPVGRRAAARGDRARAGERAADPGGRRADRQPGQPHRPPDLRSVCPPGGGRHDGADRHPRPCWRARCRAGSRCPTGASSGTRRPPARPTPRTSLSLEPTRSDWRMPMHRWTYRLLALFALAVGCLPARPTRKPGQLTSTGSHASVR